MQRQRALCGRGLYPCKWHFFGAWVSDSWHSTSLDIMGGGEVEDLPRDLVRETKHSRPEGLLTSKTTCGTKKGRGWTVPGLKEDGKDSIRDLGSATGQRAGGAGMNSLSCGQVGSEMALSRRGREGQGGEALRAGTGT